MPPNAISLRSIARLIAASTLCALSGCATTAVSPSPPPGVIRIVSSLPYKGLLAKQSKLISQAIDLAIEQRRSDIKGWSVEHQALDDSSGETGEWSREREQANANTAATDPSVVAYIGPYNSAATSLSLPVTNKAGLLQLGPTATWPGLISGGWNPGEPASYYPTGKRTYARLMPPDAQQAIAAALWMRDLGATSIYVLNDGSTYSDGLAREFISDAHSLGINVAGQARIQRDTAPSCIPALTGAHPDALFYAPSSIPDAVEVARALEGVSLKVGVFTTDVPINNQFLEGIPSALPAWRSVFNGVSSLPDTPAAANFSDAYQKRYKEPPSQFAANAYDLTNLVLNALQDGAGRDRQKVIDDVLSTRHYPGASGNVTFNKDGDITNWRMTGYRLTNGRFAQDRLITNP